MRGTSCDILPPLPSAQGAKSFQCSPFSMKSPQCALSSQPANVYNPADYVFFCSHKESSYGYGPEHANTVNEACFSNWYYHPYQPVRADDSSPLVFWCAEQEMMYRKARIFEDYAVAEDIMATQLPEAVIQVLFGESLEPSMAQRAGSSREHAEKIYKDVVGSIKALGRKVGSSPNAKKFDNSLWDPCKYAFVVDAVHSKFRDGLCEARTRAIADFLKSTGQLTIVEAAHYDKVWGVGFSVDESEERVRVCGEDGEWVSVLRRKPGIIVGGMEAVATARSSVSSAIEQGFAFGETSGPDNWPRDSNLLGRILMQVRDELRTGCHHGRRT
jgi:predicted NAD-dependent protein-ADP-ribosyltransferase YbiA (DUF1768 family)